MHEPEMNQEKAIKDIETIKNFIEQGQKKLSDNGFHFMFWGLFIPAVTLGYYLLIEIIQEPSPIYYWYWPAAMVLGAAVSTITGIRSRKREQIRGFLHRVSAYLWQGLLIAMFSTLILIITSKQGVTPVLGGCIAVILGLAYWVYGSVLQLTWFRAIGLIWWISAILLSGQNWAAASLIMAATTFICSFIPGLILYRKNKKGKI